jgi:hypothetical protein
MPDSTTILFVYNTNSGVLPSLKDYSTGKAVVSGADTCRLSAFTCSPVGTKKEWKRFLKELPFPSRSLDRIEFLSEFMHFPTSFPVVLIRRGTELSVLISTEELNRCSDLHDLTLLLEQRLMPV